jgi:hypothetical protein
MRERVRRQVELGALGTRTSSSPGTVDENDNELSRELIWAEAGLGLKLQVVHFVDLDDGRRVTSEGFGRRSLYVAGRCTRGELGEALREFIFEDDIREVDEALAGERWADMVSALRVHGVVTDDERLLALPFLVELDDDVVAALKDE